MPNQVLAVAIRLFAIGLGMSTLRMLPSLLFQGDEFRSGRVYAAFLVALTIVVALALWFFPRLIAGKLLASTSEKDASVSADTWFAMGCALVGLWTLTYAVPGLVREVFVLQWALTHLSDTATIKARFAYSVLELAIALWLVFGTNAFRRLFWWARNAGISKS